MFKKISSFVLIVLLLNVVGVSSAFAAETKEEKEAHFAGRVRAGISKLGTGTEARVEVKLRNKTKLKGYISEANAKSFTVIEANGVAIQVAYPQVKQVKGNNLSQGVTIAIVVGILAVAIILAATVFAGN